MEGKNKGQISTNISIEQKKVEGLCREKKREREA